MLALNATSKEVISSKLNAGYDDLSKTSRPSFKSTPVKASKGHWVELLNTYHLKYLVLR